MPDLSTQIYRGHIIHTPTKDKFEIIEDGYIIVVNDTIQAVGEQLPEQYAHWPINCFGNKLIIPSLCDMHIHASQYPNRGLCLDYPLLDWLSKCTFPLEAKFSDLSFARHVYQNLIHSLWEHGNLRSLIYNTIHLDATMLLFDMLSCSGLVAYVGKVNSDINVPDYLRENTVTSLEQTEQYILNTRNRSSDVFPIITPRFVVSCSPELLEGLGKLAQKYHVPVMSHLSESVKEVEMVHKMYPDMPTYADVYNHFGLLGQEPTVMAHCIYSDEREISLLAKNGVYVAHNPSSNIDLGSGMMPCRLFLEKGIDVGLGCDVAGGGTVSLFKVMTDAIGTSKLIELYSEGALPHLRASEAFYMATRGGGRFFGNVGCFLPGFKFDALVIDDTPFMHENYTLQERIERYLYMGRIEAIKERFVNGRHLSEPSYM